MDENPLIKLHLTENKLKSCLQNMGPHAPKFEILILLTEYRYISFDVSYENMIIDQDNIL